MSSDYTIADHIDPNAELKGAALAEAREAIRQQCAIFGMDKNTFSDDEIADYLDSLNGYTRPESMNQWEFAAIRKRLGLTQAELAERMGITAQTVSNYESGRAAVTVLAAHYMRSL